MKDIVENRARIGLGTKMKLFGLAVRENGLLWTMQMGVYYLGSGIADASFAAAARRRVAHGLPGMNSARMNKLIWDRWDWGAKGEEWSISPEWKTSVIKSFLNPNVPPNNDVVEIGPGAGRWTEVLIDRCRQVRAIDISETCVEVCTARFAKANNATFIVGSGADLASEPDASADAIWSFDVFVHINKAQFAPYTREFARVLRPGGRGVIHHGSVAGVNGGWRSDATTADVAKFITEAGLTVETQTTEWSDEGQEFQAGLYKDVITVFSKPR
jgi:ubiquinone/menaquinone biosynthesis C-methylase UbiE